MSPDLEASSTASSAPGDGVAVLATAPPATAFPARRSAGIVGLARAHAALIAVLACYALSAVIVPTMTPALVSDDWIFVRAAEEFRRDGTLEIPSLSAPTAIFQVAWGALFAVIFGDTFGALRLSTVVLVFLGGAATYALCRELAVDRARSALGAALYLFNPLAFVLGFSFMTDAPYTALMVIAVACYARGIRSDQFANHAVLAGSVAATLALLVRPHGALVPLGVATYLLATGRLRPNRQSVLMLARVGGVPAAAAILYVLFFARGVQSGQESFVQSIQRAGWEETWELVQHLSFFGTMYAGFFALPFVLAASPRLYRLVQFNARTAWVLFVAGVALFVDGLVNYGNDDRLMPYIPQFFARWGLGPRDLSGVSDLFGIQTAAWLTGACAAGAMLLLLALCRQVGVGPTPDRAGAGLVLAIGLWQVAGVLPPSFPFRNWTISLDRYLLPLLPFVVCLGLWAVRDVRPVLPIAWVMAAAFAAFSVAGTRDYLVFQRTTWDVARSASCAGVPMTKLDGGYSWDGYHLWGKTDENPEPAPPRTGQWWVWWWTPGNVPATDSTYIVSAAPLSGFDVVWETEYSSWLRQDETRMFLLHRQGAPTFHGPVENCAASTGSGTG